MANPIEKLWAREKPDVIEKAWAEAGQILDQLDIDIQEGRVTTLPADLEKSMLAVAGSEIDLDEVIEGSVEL